ncbi:MAG TPA: FecR family protein [Pyrinomonadaceae bacterium]|nr:FecR family protein [Pyrinomonadaceae bacterium]
MRKARPALASMLFVAALLLSLSLTTYSQNREKFVVSAKAGGVNAVTGGASMRHRNTEWLQLTIKEDLEAGDVVKTGVDGRVEMLLNPGSYMRVGENSEFELADNSLENLEVRLIRGTAIVEVTGADDEELLIGITTPHTRMSIVRRGLYRVSVVPGDTTELIVRKGRVMLEGSHTKVKGGNKVVFSGNSFSVAKLEDAEKKATDALDSWSKERSQMLAKENSRISDRTFNTLASSFNSSWFGNSLFSRRRSGFWFRSGSNCYTFVPYYGRFGSPYGGGYSRVFFGGGPGGFGGWQGSGSGRPGGYGSPQGGANNRPSSGGRTGVSNPPMTNRLPARPIDRGVRAQQ